MEKDKDDMFPTQLIVIFLNHNCRIFQPKNQNTIVAKWTSKTFLVSHPVSRDWTSERGVNKVRNALVANRSVFKLILIELNPTILKIFQIMYKIKSNHTENISCVTKCECMTV